MKELFLSVDPDVAPFQQIMEQFRRLIQRGELRAGESLPTVRQLAGDLGVAPNTVARAYTELQEEGLVVCEGRRGTRVSANISAGDTQARAHKLEEAIGDFLATLAHRGYSETEITGALRQFVR